MRFPCRSRRLAFALFFISLETGCGPSIFVPASDSYGPIVASASSVTLTSAGDVATVSLSQSGAHGSFAATGCAETIVTTAFSATTLTITAIGAGTCTLTISGHGRQTTAIAVIVTTSTVTGS